MAYIHPKVLDDLDFGQVLEHTARYAVNAPVRDRILNARPYTKRNEVEEELYRTDEMLQALQRDEAFPPAQFEPYDEELEKLRVEAYFPEPKAFLAMAGAVDTMMEWKRFLKKFGKDYPHWNDAFSLLDIRPVIAREIRSKIDRDGLVKDNASETLANIRRQMHEMFRQRDDVFSRTRKKYEKAGLLDEIGESYLDDRPVLAVRAMYRRQVPGQVLGTSRNGSIVFIEPESTAQHTRRLQNLAADEKTEIVRILKKLADFIREHLDVLAAYSRFLVEAGFAEAKARFSQEIGAVLPRLTTGNELYLRQAYHPLLLLKNKPKGEAVIPHDIHLHPRQRILVISGPNAGGKSIALKTAGLIQLMLQSGWPVPVHPESRMPFFHKILSDVGDHQSIENELSTYSYRLKNMRLFLRLADEHTLFLIDEFGTGSDPELGGALAEVFLEAFQKSGAYGIITTHYNNLKLRAEQLEGVLNAYMEFDLKKMAPTYRLITGQPGSSFTFEVAARMGIPWSIINRAKKKVDRAKVHFDRTLSQLQAEKTNLRQNAETFQQQTKALEARQKELEEQNYRLLKKLDQFRQLYEQEHRQTEAGRKILELFDRAARTGDRQSLLKTVGRWWEKEFVKQKAKKQEKPAKHQLDKTRNEVRKLLENNDVRRQLTKIEIARMPYVPKPGDRVRLKGSTANATLERIDGDKAVLNYGRFSATVPLQDLELVMRK